MSFLTGSDPSLQQVDLLSSGQTSLLDDLINRILSGSGGFGFDDDFFQSSFVDPALREFQNRIAPGIQQKFIAAGAGRGTNVQDALTRAGTDVEGTLAQLRAGLLNQGLDRQLEGSRLALGTQTQGFQPVPGSTGLLSDIGSAVGSGSANPFGQQLGKAGASAVSNLFKNFGFRR